MEGGTDGELSEVAPIVALHLEVKHLGANGVKKQVEKKIITLKTKIKHGFHGTLLSPVVAEGMRWRSRMLRMSLQMLVSSVSTLTRYS